MRPLSSIACHRWLAMTQKLADRVVPPATVTLLRSHLRFSMFTAGGAMSSVSLQTLGLHNVAHRCCECAARSLTGTSSGRTAVCPAPLRPPRDLLLLRVHVVRPRIQSSASVSPRDALRNCRQFLVFFLARHVAPAFGSCHLQQIVRCIQCFLRLEFTAVPSQAPPLRVHWRRLAELARSAHLPSFFRTRDEVVVAGPSSAILVLMPTPRITAKSMRSSPDGPSQSKTCLGLCLGSALSAAAR